MTLNATAKHVHPSLCPCPQARLLRVFRDTAGVRHARQAAGQERVLAVLRSDYMLHAPTNSLLQVRLGWAGLGAGGWVAGGDGLLRQACVIHAALPACIPGCWLLKLMKLGIP